MSRKIDALIAEHVMGWEWFSADELKNLGYVTKEVGLLFPNEPKAALESGFNVIESIIPNYSTDMAAAWEVLKWWESNEGCDWDLHYDFDDNYACRFRWLHDEGESDTDWCEVDSMPMAICLAALKAKGIDVETLETKST